MLLVPHMMVGCKTVQYKQAGHSRQSFSVRALTRELMISQELGLQNIGERGQSQTALYVHHLAQEHFQASGHGRQYQACADIPEPAAPLLHKICKKISLLISLGILLLYPMSLLQDKVWVFICCRKTFKLDLSNCTKGALHN